MEAANPPARGFFSFDPDVVPAPWRDTPGPTWQLVAALLGHQRWELEERPQVLAARQRLTFA
jgi:hypothetical protein